MADIEVTEETTSDFEKGQLFKVRAVNDGVEISRKWKDLFEKGKSWKEVMSDDL